MEIVGYVTTAIVLLCICGVALSSFMQFLASRKRQNPKIAGASIPEIEQGLDISKRYDIVYSAGEYGSHFTERLVAVRIVGYVGREDDDYTSKMFMRGRWLQVEFADRRRAYLMPRSIVSLQETAAVGAEAP